MTKSNISNIIALSKIKGIGGAFFKNKLKSIIYFQNDLKSLSELSDKINHQNLLDNLDEANQIIERCQVLSIEMLCIVDDNYPAKLLEIKDPPPILYLIGNKTLLNKNIAIIGSRDSSILGNKIANKIGSYFSENWSICNGLVDGIDKNSILSNDEVLPEVTGVLSGGLNFTFTSSKITRLLAEKVLKNNGLLVSENEPDKKEDQFSGSKASRIQAGLSLGMIIVQSSISGGSKYTLKSFCDLNRPLGVVSFNKNDEFVNSEQFSMNRLILKEGVIALKQIIDAKDITKIKVNAIEAIGNKSDYIKFEDILNNYNRGVF